VSEKHEYNIAVLLPTRGRTDALSRSVISLVNRIVNKDKVQLLFAFDNDDEIGFDHFQENIEPWLEDKGVEYEALGFERLGYGGLNQYYNTLAKQADADWFFIWNDDAIMETTGWDSIISKRTGEFKLLSVRTHNDHPYSIFPIIPADWYDALGFFSRHQMIDAEVSQFAYMLDIFERIEIYVTHDRYDLTGNNLDDTDKERVRYEGNPSNPMDYHNPTFIAGRQIDVEVIAKLMESKNLDLTWYNNVKTGQQNPWVKMAENDPNKQTMAHLSVTK
jgi:hypothetical protein